MIDIYPKGIHQHDPCIYPQIWVAGQIKRHRDTSILLELGKPLRQCKSIFCAAQPLLQNHIFNYVFHKTEEIAIQYTLGLGFFSSRIVNLSLLINKHIKAIIQHGEHYSISKITMKGMIIQILQSKISLSAADYIRSLFSRSKQIYVIIVSA